MKCFISNFKIHHPPTELTQANSLAWLNSLHSKRDPNKSERISKFIQKFGVDPEKISFRKSFVSDFGLDDFSKNTLFTKDNDYNPRLSERSALAQRAFEDSAENLFDSKTNAPEHLLHVSCTHYESPSAAQKIALKNRWNTTVTHMYHMGCYAALPAVRTARALCREGQVDILHTEICSLHLNCDSYSPEQLVVQSLFADGAIRYSCHSNHSPEKGKAFEVLSLQEMLVPGTETDMTWKLHENRFDMTLSKNVPKYLGEYLEGFMQKLFQKAGLDYENEKAKAIFAVHPGGPKIIDLAQELLELREDQVENSKRILKNRGNMSSATLPHVWSDILDENQDKLVATVAFGPGLTMTGALFKLC